MTGLLWIILGMITILKPIDVSNIYANTTIIHTTGYYWWEIRHDINDNSFIGLDLWFNGDDLISNEIITHEIGHYLCIKHLGDYTERCAWKITHLLIQVYWIDTYNWTYK